MTQRLYEEDAYLKEFDAVVTGCTEKGGRYRIALDRSAFFPEGGGQSGDRGYLVLSDGTRIDVSDTHGQEEDVFVICQDPVRPGERVHGVLDWDYRFDRMQNHSGEHIVSGLIHSRFGYHNVGFHMSADRVTIDLDGEIPEEGLAELERRANEIIWENHMVHTQVCTCEEAKNIEYRSKKELSGMIRVVTIDGADVCACCGTHVRSTGEIGIIKLLSHEKFKGGVRMEMMSGRWAFRYLCQIYRQNHEVSMQLSSRMLETGGAALRLVEENARLKGELIAMRYAQIDRKAAQLEGAGDVLLFVPGADAVTAQKLTAKVMETCGGAVFSFAGSDEDGYKYAAGWKGNDLKELVREMNASLGGRGGGKPFFQQGSVTSARDQIERFLRGKYPELSVDNL